MGKDLHYKMMDTGIPSCVYAPVGPPKELLSYLIRRLMENSANSSFINQLYQPNTYVNKAIADPIGMWEELDEKMHPAIPLPKLILKDKRINSAGVNLYNPLISNIVLTSLKSWRSHHWQAAPIINGKINSNQQEMRECINPAFNTHIIGECVDAIPSQVNMAIESLYQYLPKWSSLHVNERCTPIERLANILEENRDELIALLVYEGGKTIQDAINEIREAVDYCRYYTIQAQKLLSAPITLDSISGESNHLSYHGRGVFVCISPWNFPLAITLGQIIAALVTGNTVLVKPAEQTTLISGRLFEMMLDCGIPKNAIALATGDADIGQEAIKNEKIAGVAFTGSIETAKHINRALAAKDGPIIPLIAETGGINAMIVDSSGLPEQVVDDVISSAFRSAGQRCSALRLLCLQDSIADHVISLLKGALQELRLGDPSLLNTDIGPVIDQTALENLNIHEQRLKNSALFISSARLPHEIGRGHFFVPQIWEIPSIQWLDQEVFGPILHIVRFKTGDLNHVVSDINQLGYGLTGGIHSRIAKHIDYARQHTYVGNFYINRSIIGASVGMQPFGGHALSGTGPKAGGQNMLMRFLTERVTTDNLTACMGDTKLLSLEQ
jgi:RHH-type proline utilization regulon transcriptional repressor/proline dehydrogenase/delta 1-pyrroline-5-carboxylate dehydrogenase